MLENIRKKKKIIFIIYLAVIIYMAVKGYSLGSIALAVGIMALIFVLIFHAGFYGLIGIFNYALSNQSRAKKYLYKSIKANTTQPTVYLNYAVILMKEGMAAQALDYLKMARDMNRKIPTDQNISLTIASCYLILGKSGEAVETLEDLHGNYDKTSNYAKDLTAYAYFRAGKYNEAFETIKGISENEMTASEWETLGLLHYKTGHIEDAKYCMAKALSMNENLIECNYYMAEILYSEGDEKEARKYYEKASNCPLPPLGGVKPEDAKKRLEEVGK